jgi:hypothetical protein
LKRAFDNLENFIDTNSSVWRTLISESITARTLTFESPIGYERTSRGNFVTHELRRTNKSDVSRIADPN